MLFKSRILCSTSELSTFNLAHIKQCQSVFNGKYAHPEPSRGSFQQITLSLIHHLWHLATFCLQLLKQPACFRLHLGTRKGYTISFVFVFHWYQVHLFWQWWNKFCPVRVDDVQPVVASIGDVLDVHLRISRWDCSHKHSHWPWPWCRGDTFLWWPRQKPQACPQVVEAPEHGVPFLPVWRAIYRGTSLVAGGRTVRSGWAPCGARVPS